MSEQMSWLLTGPGLADAAAVTAAEVLGWSGTVLPATTLLGCRVVPVVQLDLDVHQRRAADGDGPQLDADTLAMWEWPQAADQAPPSPLRLVGFMLQARRGWRRALGEARSWRGFGPVAVLAAPEVVADEVARLEFSLHGIGLVTDRFDQSSEDVVAAVTGAEPERVTGARRRSADRWIEEVLYAHAIDEGYYQPGE